MAPLASGTFVPRIRNTASLSKKCFWTHWSFQNQNIICTRLVFHSIPASADDGRVAIVPPPYVLYVPTMVFALSANNWRCHFFKFQFKQRRHETFDTIKGYVLLCRFVPDNVTAVVKQISSVFHVMLANKSWTFRSWRTARCGKAIQILEFGIHMVHTSYLRLNHSDTWLPGP